MSHGREDHLHGRLLGLVTAKLIVKPLYVLAELGIPDKLADGPRTVDALAAETGTHAPSLRRVLRAVTASGLAVFKELPGDRFALGAAGKFLCDGPRSVKPHLLWYNDALSDGAWQEFRHSVETGEAALPRAIGEDEWHRLDHDPQAAARMAAMMHADVDEKWPLLDGADLADVGMLVDVGGGPAALLCRALQKVPTLRGAVLEQPAMIPHGQATIDAAGLAGRAAMIAGDFRREVPPADAHLLSFVLHNWSDDDATTILKNCARAVTGPRRLLVIEALLPGSDQPSFFHRLDLHMLAMHGGRERDSDSLVRLLAAAGYQVTRVHTPVPGGASLIDARRIP